MHQLKQRATEIPQYLKGVVSEHGIERFFFTSEVLGEKLSVVVERFAQEEVANQIQNQKVPNLVSCRMESFPHFYVFPNSYTHCSVTATDLEAMQEIFKSEFNKTIKWPPGVLVGHCPVCGHSDVFTGRFSIEAMAKSYFNHQLKDGGERHYSLEVVTHFMPRVFHEKCYQQLSKLAEGYNVQFPAAPEPKYHITHTGYEFPILTEQWLKVQKLVRALDGQIRINLNPRVFTETEIQVFGRNSHTEIFLHNITHEEMKYYALCSGLVLTYTEEEFENDNVYPTDERYYRSEGNKKMISKEYRTAIDLYNKSILASPINYFSWCQRATAFISLNKYEESLLDFEECIKLNPKWVKGYLFRGLSQLHLRQYKDALVTLNYAGSMCPDDKDVAQKLLAAVNLAYEGDGIDYYVNIIEDKQYQDMHFFLSQVCLYICNLCKVDIGELGKNGLRITKLVPHHLTLDKESAAKLAIRLNTLDVKELKQYAEVFQSIAGQDLCDHIKSVREKKAREELLEIKQTQELHKRLVALQTREGEIIRELKMNKDKTENTKQTAKGIRNKKILFNLKKALADERKYLDQELDVIRESKTKIEEALERRRPHPCSTGVFPLVDRQEKIPCSKSYSPEQLRSLPWRLIEKAQKKGMLSETRLRPSKRESMTAIEPFSDEVECGAHLPIGVVLDAFMLGSYSSVWERATWAAGHRMVEQGANSSDTLTATDKISKSSCYSPEEFPSPDDFENIDAFAEFCMNMGSNCGAGIESVEDDKVFLDAFSSVEDLTTIHELSTSIGDLLHFDERLRGIKRNRDQAQNRRDHLRESPDKTLENCDHIQESCDQTRESREHARKNCDQVVEQQQQQRMCANCGLAKIRLSKCGKCLKVYYCSRNCQKEDRKWHRQECK